MTSAFPLFFPLLAFLALNLAPHPAQAAQAEPSQVSSPQSPMRMLPKVERLEYILRFGLALVGRATLEIDTPDALAATQELLEIDTNTNISSPSYTGEGRSLLLAARSTSLTRMVYTVKNRIAALTTGKLTAGELTGSRVYGKQIRQGSARRRYRVDFNGDRTVRTDFARNGTVLTGPIVEKPGNDGPLFDPLTALHALRLAGPVPGGSYSELITDGKNTHFMDVTISGPEIIEVDAGRFKTLKAQVRLNGVDGVFRTGPAGHFTVWVTNGFPHTPVKVQSFIRVGPFKGMLRADLWSADPKPAALPRAAKLAPNATTTSKNHLGAPSAEAKIPLRSVD